MSNIVNRSAGGVHRHNYLVRHCSNWVAILWVPNVSPILRDTGTANLSA